MSATASNIVQILLSWRLIDIPSKIFGQNSLLLRSDYEEVAHCHSSCKFIDNWSSPVALPSGKEKNVAPIYYIWLCWPIDHDAGKVAFFKNTILVKVPNLDDPVRTIIGRFDLSSELVSELNICYFCDLLSHVLSLGAICQSR